MRFLAELSGNRFKYGNFISKNSYYDLVFANYDTEYITRMGGSYELNSVIPAHGNRFAITSAKYTEPFSDEFEIVNLNGVIPENKVAEIRENLFMNGIGYKKLQYYGLSFKFKLKVTNNEFNFVSKNYIVLYNLPEEYRPREREVIFNVTGSHNELILFIQSNGNVGLRTTSGALSETTETQNTIIEVSGSYIPYVYPININVNLDYNTLQGYKESSDPRTVMQEGSELVSFSSTYLNCIFTDPEAIEGGVNGQWGTIGFKFTLTADSQYCWEDKSGFTLSGASCTFYSGDVATIIPPKITITLNGTTTLYTVEIESETFNKNSISFKINNNLINIDIPDNGTDDNNIYKDHSIVVANAPLKFIIDPKLRQVYGEYIDSGKTKMILGYPENRTDLEPTYISLASVFKGFKTIPKGLVTINELSGNIQSIQFGDYNVGYLI